MEAATTHAHERSRPARGASALPVALGIGALLLRSALLGLPPHQRVVLLACLYSAIWAGSILIPIPRERAHMRPGAVMAIGAAALLLAAAASGRPPAMSFAPMAVPLSLVAAVAEEALFRRTAYGWLIRWGAAAAVIGSAVLFALVHLPLYGASALPVDLGAGLLFSWQRWASGDWTVPAATHASANLIAAALR